MQWFRQQLIRAQLSKQSTNRCDSGPKSHRNLQKKKKKNSRAINWIIHSPMAKVLLLQVTNQSNHATRKKPKEPGRRPCVVQGYLTEMCLVKAAQFQKSFQCDIQDAKIFMRGHQVFTASPYNKSFTDIWTPARIVKVSEGQVAPSCRFTQERSEGKRSHLDANEEPGSKNKSSAQDRQQDSFLPRGIPGTYVSNHDYECHRYDFKAQGGDRQTDG